MIKTEPERVWANPSIVYIPNEADFVDILFAAQSRDPQRCR